MTVEAVRADRAHNAGASARALLVAYRIAVASSRASVVPRFVTAPLRLAFRVVSKTVFGVDLPLGTRVGPGLALPHPQGIVVHEAAILGAGCTLRHNVTIGVRRTGESVPGVPVIGDGVDVGAGAQILGGVTIGADATIGAGAIVLCDVPSGSIAVGNPARVLAAARAER